jgi:hypothetical protein
MAGPGLVVAVTLILLFVPVWALIWGRKQPGPTLIPVRDPGPDRLGQGRPANDAR